MATSQDADAPIRQRFHDANGNMLQSLPTHVEPDTNVRYVLWSDILRTFAEIYYIEDRSIEWRIRRVFFMVNESYQVYIPLRLYFSIDAYTVIRKHTAKAHLSPSEKSSHPLHRIWMELQDCINLYDLFADYNFRDMDTFLKYAATKDYFRTQLLKNLAQIDTTSTDIRNEVAKMRHKVANLDRYFPGAIEYDRMSELLKRDHLTQNIVRRSPNRLFLILPTSLDHWDAADTATHTFRLYFLCNARYVHVSDHPGYNIDGPQEFLQQYGHHALAMLFLVKYGFSNVDYCFPRLDTFELLRIFKGITRRHGLTKDTFGHLVDTTIAYIQALLEMKWDSTATINRPSLWGITSFLQLNGDNDAGGLSRSGSEHELMSAWVCRRHALFSDSGAKILGQYVYSQGGTVDLQTCTVRINIKSTSGAAGLAKLLKQTERTLEVFLRITWKATRIELLRIAQLISVAELRLLHVLGISPSFVSQGPLELSGKSTGLTIIYDYPRRNQTYVIVSQYGMSSGKKLGLLLRGQVDIYGINWERLASDLYSRVNRSNRGYLTTEAIVDHSVLQDVTNRLGQHKEFGFTGIDVSHPRTNDWQGRIGVKEGVAIGLVEASIPSNRFHPLLLKQGMLRRLVLRSSTAEDMLQVASLMAFSPRLHRIEIQIQEGNVFRCIEFIRRNRHRHTHPLEVNFFHQWDKDPVCVVIRGQDSTGTVQNGIHGQNTESIGVAEWHLDRVSERLQDRGAELLCTAAKQSPSSLTRFTLDITALSAQGLTSIIEVLQKSTLERLHIRCVPFMPFMGASIGKVIRAIRWHSIKSLVLSGSNIDDWLQLWNNEGDLQDLVKASSKPSVRDLSLLSLEIVESEENQTVLSHASALTIHHLIYLCRLVELHLENVLLKGHDWFLVLSIIHHSTWMKQNLRGCNIPDAEAMLSFRAKEWFSGPFKKVPSRRKLSQK